MLSEDYSLCEAASVQFLDYDARGRSVGVARRIANPDPSVVVPATRYRGRFYTSTTSYDAADRVVRESTGAISPEFKDASSKSEIQIDYSARGTLRRVYGSYGDLITSVKRSADGQIEEVKYGDAAGTTLAQTYTSRRWLESTRVSRLPPAFWTAPPANYSPAPTPGTASAFQTVLRDELYGYDIVGNPTAITDRRTASEWPAGAKPVSRTITYDDLYRVASVDYSYPGGSDTFTSPFAYEQSGATDPRQSSNFARRLVLAQRVKKQTYKYDWLGSLTQANDDLNAMWDRGVGPIGNYASTGMPYRWKNAGDSALATWPGNGAADALAYDETGNLLDLQITRIGTCTGGGTTCDLRFTYAYDELGRLNGAQRREGSTLKADFRFTYDNADNRTLKSDNTLAQKLHTAYIFDSLELRRTTFDNTSGDYAANSQTETVFLSANGVRVGRVTYEGNADGEPRLGNDRRHVLLEVGDHLGSTSVVIDKATSELAERITFQPYGATESDYRPDRWKGFREDYRFTGKEEDIEVGLTYFGKRFLSAPLGRWVSPDPLAVHAPGKADLNLYAYVHGRLLKNVDPLGLDDVTDAAKATIAGDERPIDALGQESDALQSERAKALKAGDAESAAAYEKMLADNDKAVNALQRDIVGLKSLLSNRPAEIDIGMPSDGGREDYYLRRAADFMERNPGQKPPEYYTEYGDGGMRRFTALRPTLSQDGQGWITLARYHLQAQLESRIKNDPENFASLERNPDALRAFAFQTHVPAYFAAGIQQLGWGDRWDIAWTPRRQDILNGGAIVQMLVTGGLVLSEDFTHNFALDYGFQTGPGPGELGYAAEKGW